MKLEKKAASGITPDLDLPCSRLRGRVFESVVVVVF
jgi:hypothetical protein